MRKILVDWLIEVAEEYKLVLDTLYLTVSYVDRYLSSQVLSRNKLQLLGVSCMHIASKYEDISPPNVEDFCYVTDNTYNKEEAVCMEKEVLTKAAQENCKSRNLQFEFLSCYFAELSIRLWMSPLLTICNCCIGCFPLKIHYPSGRASLECIIAMLFRL